MTNFSGFKPPYCLILACAAWWSLAGVAFGDDDALSAPKTGNQPKLVNPPAGSGNSEQTVEPADVVDQKPGFIIPTPGKSTPSSTATSTPALTLSLDSRAKKNPTPTPIPTPTSTPKPRTAKSKNGGPSVTTIPNPAWGDKVIFRIMTSGTAKARIVVYDRFFSKVADLTGDGDRLFDILWSLKKIPEGLYYYQVEVVEVPSGQIQMLPMQNFAVLKDASPDNDR